MERTFKDRWDLFDHKLIQGKYGPNQRENFRRCFYAGALALAGLMETADMESTDGMMEVVHIMDELKSSVKGFSDERTEGTTVERGETVRVDHGAD